LDKIDLDIVFEGFTLRNARSQFFKKHCTIILFEATIRVILWFFKLLSIYCCFYELNIYYKLSLVNSNIIRLPDPRCLTCPRALKIIETALGGSTGYAGYALAYLQSQHVYVYMHAYL
jgi:hypothetical protein